MSINRYIITSAVAVMVAASGASAGGLTAEVVEPAVVVPVMSAPVANRFAGGYVGGAISYSFGGEDRLGIHTPTGTYVGDVGDLEVSGAAGSLFGGYRWNSGKWLFGPELNVRFGDITDDLDYLGPIPAATNASSEISWEAAIRGTVGYEISPTSMVYGFVGYTRSEVDYVTTGAINLDETVSLDGVTAGFGGEYAFNDSWALRGEYAYSGYGKEELIAPAGGRVTNASIELHTISVGVTYSF
ncbi:outer membrane protein [Ketogulonicigenium vulgare]|nr:outer membrane beta-barrel protein [Ketogulonicigenium vulgare]